MFKTTERPYKNIPLRNNVSDSGARLSAFSSEEECRTAYAEMIQTVRDQITQERVRFQENLIALENDLDSYEEKWGKA